jgi:N-acetylneuraminate lyase
MNAKNLHGLIAAPFTPMTETGEINTGPIVKYARHLINSKVAGAFVCGTTGEGISMTTVERNAILREWVTHSGNELKIIAHVGGNSLPQSMELAAFAERQGAYAIASFAPSFFKPGTAGELVSFLAPIAAAAPDTPFYFYHFPSLTGVNIPVISFLEEADGIIPTLAGVKYTHFDLYDMQQCMAYKDGKYEILHGYDEVLLGGLALGVRSAVGSTYNYMAPLYLRLWEAFNRGDLESARKHQQVSVQVVRQLNKYGGGVRAGKEIMKLTGIDCGPCRLPIRPFSPEESDSLRVDLETIGFFEYTGKV